MGAVEAAEVGGGGGGTATASTGGGGGDSCYIFSSSCFKAFFTFVCLSSFYISHLFLDYDCMCES